MKIPTPISIAAGTEVNLHFSLGLADGSIIDSNFDAKPVTFVMGDGNLLPGFEACLTGLVAGEHTEFTVAAEKAFGRYNEDNVQRFRRDQLAGYALEPGLVISFADAAGAELPGVVIAVDDAVDDTDDNAGQAAEPSSQLSYVSVDFNHPLADRDIIFKVKIIAVRPAVAVQQGTGL